MKRINWNTEKSLVLKASRGICFEDVIFFVERGEILDDYLHPNQEVYPGQRIMVIGMTNYAYLVPYVENEEELFLKTIIPSRKATQQYFGEKHES
ncbi:BrnT family toxin [Chlorobium phaeobacteroides]|uniref:Toxin n=1 Tax=Chlorobium phaeobacteroides (strain DSM 266 / SMG 266 / 2430) TaxID=290317 RepID=A1BD75_CHLPD|nr:BrnT family toxin [Chlorobium phaeobacteroides]ABL64352.1 conserved hypothetical protein [Chlorobium phaeobacteroides DSM 266]